MLISEESKQKPIFLSLLTVLCTTALLIGLTVQDRIISIGSTYAAATIFVYPLTCWILDIVAEIYGYKEARKLLWLIMLANFSFALVVYFITKLPSPHFWMVYTDQFNNAMSPIFRTSVVAILAMIVGQYINIYAISKLRALTKGRFFALRSITSTILGDTVTFALSISGFFVGRMSEHEIFVIIFTELFIMYAYAIVLAPIGNVIVALLRKVEPSLPYYSNVKFNPFA